MLDAREENDVATEAFLQGMVSTQVRSVCAVGWASSHCASVLWRFNFVPQVQEVDHMQSLTTQVRAYSAVPGLLYHFDAMIK